MNLLFILGPLAFILAGGEAHHEICSSLTDNNVACELDTVPMNSEQQVNIRERGCENQINTELMCIPDCILRHNFAQRSTTSTRC